MAKWTKQTPFPELDAIQDEMRRSKNQSKYHQALKSTAGTIVVVAAIAVLVASIFLPVLRVTGTSMQPNFAPGNVLVALKTRDYVPGDVCSFYYNNKLIIKRVIATGGDVLEIDEDGRVSVNGLVLDESYVRTYDLGLCDIDFPYTVPAEQLFVMGDNRASSVDSRVQAFGCISKEELMGKVVLRVWPLQNFAYYGI
ncbi:MAG: signal peptidase I [Clostridia bacterium]|nr:signal peptidase I [Clostridia bacterium]